MAHSNKFAHLGTQSWALDEDEEARTAEVATASNDPADRLDCQQAAARRGIWSSRLSRFPRCRAWDSTASGSWRERPTCPLCLRWRMTRRVRSSIIGAVISSQLFFSPKILSMEYSRDRSERSIRQPVRLRTDLLRRLRCNLGNCQKSRSLRDAPSIQLQRVGANFCPDHTRPSDGKAKRVRDTEKLFSLPPPST